jgi:hypothetical protein
MLTIFSKNTYVCTFKMADREGIAPPPLFTRIRFQDERNKLTFASYPKLMLVVDSHHWISLTHADCNL